jgi:uncharacterized protein (DUF1501 family)
MLDHLHTRRVFLSRGLTMLAVGSTVPTFLANATTILAAPDDLPRVQQPNGKDGKILVVVQLSGGNDGLNTIVPYADDAYYRARPALGIAKDKVLKATDYLGFNPQLAPLKNLFDDGKMAIVQGVGYPNPNRSHFRSMDIWHTAQPEKEVVTNGWLGRYFDACCSGTDPHLGVGIGEQAPLAMKGDKTMPLAFDRPEAYRYNGSDLDTYNRLNQVKDPAPAAPATQPAGQNWALRRDARDARTTRNQPAAAKVPAPSAGDQLEFLTRTAMDAQLSSDRVLRAVRGHNPNGYPGGSFGNGLKTIAAMIKGGLPTRVYYVSLGGFDTHAGQQGRHDQLMTQFAQGVSAFMADMKAQGNDQRVLVMSFSEFGRRVAQNASAGTDHGAAAPMFLFGNAVANKGIVGRHPSLTDLDSGDLKFGVDFRNVYATVLESWLDAPSKPILGGQFRTLPLIKA